MSWGFKILFLYLGFVLLIVTMVGLTMRENVDLVSEDYYQQELDYQEKIDKRSRTAALKEPLTWTVTPDTLVLTFPKDLVGRKPGGSVFFFRPSDARLDRKFPITAIRDSVCSIPLKGLVQGLYRLEIDWHAGGTEYYNETIIQFP